MDVRKLTVGLILVALMVALMFISVSDVHAKPSQAGGIPSDPPETVGDAMWDDRGLDVMVQMAIILAGAFGVLAMVKGVKNRD